MSKSIIKSNSELKEKIKERIKELNLTLTFICKDAKERGMNLSIHSLSKYLNDYEKNNLSEENIRWIAFRWGIPVYLIVGTPSITEEKKIKLTILPYNEKKCLEMLEKVFPQSKPVDKPKKNGKPKAKRIGSKKHGVSVE